MDNPQQPRPTDNRQSGVAVITYLIICIAWIAGIVVAKGWVSTIIAIFFAPYAWYLVVELIMTLNGWI